MQQELKQKIVDHAKKYAAENSGMSQNALAKHADINPGYLSNMLRGNFSTEVDGKQVPISDKWFHQLATAIGFALTKQYWGVVQTQEFSQIIHELTVAKNDSRVITIITDTGFGKTYSVNKFCLANPQHTFKITVTALHKVRDIILLLAEAIGVPPRFTSSSYQNYTIGLLLSITDKLKELKMMGHQPLVIIDEAENLKLPVIQVLKGLYDHIVGYSSMVMIGTSQLTDALLRMRNKNKNGAPQFYRRIKAGIRIIPADKDFNAFYKKFKIEDKGLCSLLNSLCDNYGELHDYLEPALRAADEKGKPLTEQFFRIMYNLPNYK